MQSTQSGHSIADPLGVPHFLHILLFGASASLYGSPASVVALMAGGGLTNEPLHFENGRKRLVCRSNDYSGAGDEDDRYASNRGIILMSGIAGKWTNGKYSHS
ncbi:MAG: hypothetical protein KAT00_03685 [Planctomycetes bacterium]|nr:hypothetical protein [Planctomycetota bacterium]